MLWCFYFWRFWLITNIVIFHLKIYLFYLLLFSSFHVSKKKIVFFSCYDYYYWMVKKKLYFFSIKFPAYIYTCLWSHKVETFLEPERNLFVLVNRQLRLKRCRILWSSIHDCMSLGLSCGDVSHEIHVVCWWLERRLGALLIGTSSNWF